MTQIDNKGLLHQIFVDHLDPMMGTYTFKRTLTGSTFKRKLPDCVQKLDFFLGRPKYQEDPALAVITPSISIDFPQIGKLSVSLPVPPDIAPLLARPTLQESIGLLGPSRSLVDWRPESINEFQTESGPSIANFVEKYVIPFFEEYRTIAQFAAGYRVRDPRLSSNQIQWLKAAIALYIDSGSEKAYEYLNNKYSTPSLQKEYREILVFFRDK